MKDVKVRFPIEEVEWSSNTITEMNVPFYLTVKWKSVASTIRVDSYPIGAPINGFLADNECDITILKGSIFRKTATESTAITARNKHKAKLSSLKGLSFKKNKSLTSEQITLKEDIQIKNITLSSVRVLLGGNSEAATDKISFNFDQNTDSGIAVGDLQGRRKTKSEAAYPPSKAILDARKDSFSKEAISKDYEVLQSTNTSDLTKNSENHNQLYADILNRRKNIILEGPPGTGKTHAIKGIVEQLEKSKEDGGEGLEIGGKGKGKWAITMHPATSYEDFIEGLRPAEESDKDAKSRFIYKPGVFVERVREAIQNPHQQHVVLLDELNRSNVPRVLGDLLTTLEASKRTKRYNYSESGNKNLTPIKSCDAEIIYLQYTDKDKDSLSEKRDELLQKIEDAGVAEFSEDQLKSQIKIITPPTKRVVSTLIKQLKEEVRGLLTNETKGNRNIITKLCEIRNIPISNTAVDSFRPGSKMYSGSDIFKYIGNDGTNVEILSREKRKGKESHRDIGHGKVISSCLVSKDGEKYCAFLKYNDVAHPILAKDVNKLIQHRKQSWHGFEIDNLSILDKNGRQLEVAVMGTTSISPGTDGDRYSQFIDVKIADYYESGCSGACQFESSERYWCDLCDRNWNKEKRTEVTLSGSKKKLHIPDNVLVVGTMNTTDRSVAPLDSALRRRFVFLRVDPQTGIFKKAEKKYQSLSDDGKKYFEEAEKNWKSLNEWLDTNLGKDATIGHSYLFELIEQLSKTKDSIGVPEKYTKQMWQYSILPQVADLLDATGQANALWDKNPNPENNVKEYLQNLKLKLVTPNENMNRTFSRTLVKESGKKPGNTNSSESTKTKGEEE